MTTHVPFARRFAAVLGLVAPLVSIACGTTPAPASTTPTSVSTEPEASERPAAPMYKPSSRSPAPMRIDDPAYGAYADAPDAPGLGDTLPDFEVALADGGTFELAKARQAGPVLVMFYRGFW